jgi:Tfp pilus assembly protein PilX
MILKDTAVNNLTPPSMRCTPRKQRGAALVVGLLLLLVITLLAVAGMNSSATEFIMAGNEQFHQNAFQAAQTGIEQTIVNGTFDPTMAPVTVTQNIVPVTGSPTDSYSTTLSADLGGAHQPALWGNDPNAFWTYDFTIASTGLSVRKAKTIHVQGIAVLAPAGGDTPPDPATPPGTSPVLK